MLTSRFLFVPDHSAFYSHEATQRFDDVEGGAKEDFRVHVVDVLLQVPGGRQASIAVFYVDDAANQFGQLRVVFQEQL